MTIDPAQLDEAVAALSDDDFRSLVERTRQPRPSTGVQRGRDSYGKSHSQATRWAAH